MSKLVDQVVTYEALYNKYNGFIVPTVEIKVEGTPLPEEIQQALISTELELTTVTTQMNVATFVVANLYNYEKECFDDAVIKTYFKLGNRVEIAVGYLVTEPLFKGYIYETQFSLDVETGIIITVTCKDFKGLLSNKQGDLKRLGCSRVGEVRNILVYPSYGKFAKLPAKQLFYLEALELVETALRLLGAMPDQHDPMTTELEKVQTLAQSYGYEFFIFYDQIYFRPSFIKDKAEIMSISPLKGILKAVTNYNIGEIVDMVEIRGQDPDDMSPVTGVAMRKIPSEVTTNTAATGITMRYDESVTGKVDAFKKAFMMLSNNAWKSSQIQVECIGIPDIVPGRYIKIEGLSPNMNKSVYIKTVSHKIDQEGYTTHFTGRIKLYG